MYGSHTELSTTTKGHLVEINYNFSYLDICWVFPDSHFVLLVHFDSPLQQKLHGFLVFPRRCIM